ncbi:MAG TPA: hypothetical protein VG204_05610 [Terriglobia bacterium]|nr:hypothetical protein [Terriglobia bacterium]
MPKQPHSTILLVLAILAVALATLTVLPFPSSHTNLIGYHSLCAFVPLSTLILLGAAGFLAVMRSTLYSNSSRRPSDTSRVERQFRK